MRYAVTVRHADGLTVHSRTDLFGALALALQVDSTRGRDAVRLCGDLVTPAAILTVRREP